MRLMLGFFDTTANVGLFDAVFMRAFEDACSESAGDEQPVMGRMSNVDRTPIKRVRRPR